LGGSLSFEFGSDLLVIDKSDDLQKRIPIKHNQEGQLVIIY
jgi:hypothetical protein